MPLRKVRTSGEGVGQLRLHGEGDTAKFEKKGLCDQRQEVKNRTMGLGSSSLWLEG